MNFIPRVLSISGKPYHQHHSSSLTMRKSCSSDPRRCYKRWYISVDATGPSPPSCSRTTQRRIPSPENAGAIIGVLTAKPSRKDEKFGTEPHDRGYIQQRIWDVGRLAAMLEEYDTDINARESALWETAVNTTLKRPHGKSDGIHITLNRPELPETKEENQISVRAENGYKTC